MNIAEMVYARAKEAKEAARALLKVSSAQKEQALLRMAELLLQEADFLKKENSKDIESAKEKGLSPALIDRLTLTDRRIEEMAQGLREVAAMRDPVGEVTSMWQRPNGMVVGRMRVPIGVIGIIYESRPNVTADATGLCLKASNAVLLRGGSEAINSNMAIVNILRRAIAEAGLPEAAVSFIDITDRQAIMEMIKLEGLVDLVIPRGGEGLIRTVTENSRVPVLKHYKGVCHVFVDRDADLRMAEEICFNAKVQRPGVCNAMETMLVDEAVAKEFLPSMLERFKQAGVRLKGCDLSRSVVQDLEPLSEEDLYNEYLDLVLNVKVVSGIDEAIEHINKYSSQHTDAIVTKDYSKALRFLREVDSAAVLVNASTRFHDGGQFGLGAEIGISTDKIHARGSMGVEELTCQKFIVFGTGQVRQ